MNLFDLVPFAARGLSPVRDGRASVLTVATILCLAGCTKAAVSTPNESDNVLATVDGQKITMADVHSTFADQFDETDLRYKRARYGLVQAGLDSLLKIKLIAAEAKRKNTTPAQLVAEEAGPGLHPSATDVSSWYNSHLGRVGGRPLAQVQSQISALLQSERLRAAENRLVTRLRGGQNVAILLEPFRMTFNNTGAPKDGDDAAPVKLVEFSEFQCSACLQMADTLRKVKAAYGDKVQIVYRQFPLTQVHQFAQKTAEASLCANDQGKFWEMHDAMYADQAKLAIPDLEAKAASLNMDAKKFNTCLETATYARQVQTDMREGQRGGIDGPPSLFINGVLFLGSRTTRDISAVIDSELGRKPTKSD